MASIVVSGDTSGAITIAAPAVAGTNTLTLPTNTGTIITTASSGGVSQAMLATGVTGNGPAFAATLSNQSVAGDTNAKMEFNNEVFDTASCYNNTGSTVGGIPSYSFLPNVAGYYQVSINCFWLSYTAGVNQALSLWLNNSGATELFRLNFPNGNSGGSRLIYLNGTTDYINAYWYSTNGTSTLVGNNGAFFSNFSAALVRSA
jgi:hypothetical protein